MTELLNTLLNTTWHMGAPDWLIMLISYILTVVVIFAVAPLQMLFFTYYERRAIARMQDRIGPNRVGWEGVLQPLADGVKMFTKEDIVPTGADKWLHFLAPCVSVAPIMFMFAVIPWGPNMAPSNLETGLLFFFAVSSLSTLGILMAGWGSNNKFSLLGALRGVAQVVSYEIPALLSMVAVVLLVGGMSIAGIVSAQDGAFVNHSISPSIPQWGLGWLLFTPVGFLGFICFFIAALAEGERTPFDIPEADSEIVAGFMTEYSGMKFGLFYLAQYLLNFLLCGITATVFLGGWQGPGVSWLLAQGVSAANAAGNPWLNVAAGVLGVFYFLLKTYILFFVMVLIRGALPRLRTDQLMGLGWKFLIPLTIWNLLSAALWVALLNWGSAQGVAFLDSWGAWQRWGIAFALTLCLNLSGFFWLLRANRTPSESIEELVEDQIAGAVVLP